MISVSPDADDGSIRRLLFIARSVCRAHFAVDMLDTMFYSTIEERGESDRMYLFVL